MKNNYYYIKIRNSYINYLNLKSHPLRLRNSSIDKESIAYSIEEISIVEELLGNQAKKIELEECTN
jgi:hypothetical protein